MPASLSLSRVIGGVSSPRGRHRDGGGNNGSQTIPYPQLNKGQSLPGQQRKDPLLALGALSLHPCHLQPD